MADNTCIEWTEATWNPIGGCTRVDEGCRNCCAEVMAARFSGPGQWGEGLARMVKGADGRTDHRWTGTMVLHEAALDRPLRWRRPRLIFVNSTSDLFHESVPDDWIDCVFAVMALCPQHTFQVLTKRPERAMAYLARRDDRGRWPAMDYAAIMAATGRWDTPALDLRNGWPLPNVWLGTSISDQASADARIPELLACPAAVRFVSAEPLLGPVDLTRVGNLAAIDNVFPTLVTQHRRDMAPEPISGAQIDAINGVGSSCLLYQTPNHMGGFSWEFPRRFPRLDWVICGGESGTGARPMHPDWARSLRDQCVAAGVPFFFKQWGEWGSGFVHMVTGERVFRAFPNYQKWVQKAPTWVNGGICMDALGRHCKTGADMMRARDEGTFPVTIMHRVGKKAAGRLLDGRTWDQMPGGVTHG